jgi:hypothetical protein
MVELIRQMAWEHGSDECDEEQVAEAIIQQRKSRK